MYVPRTTFLPIYEISLAFNKTSCLPNSPEIFLIEYTIYIRRSILRIAIQYRMSRAMPGAGIVSATYEAHIGYQVTSLFESDNHDLVILLRWL